MYMHKFPFRFHEHLCWNNLYNKLTASSRRLFLLLALHALTDRCAWHQVYTDIVRLKVQPCFFPALLHRPDVLIAPRFLLDFITKHLPTYIQMWVQTDIRMYIHSSIHYTCTVYQSISRPKEHSYVPGAFQSYPLFCSLLVPSPPAPTPPPLNPCHSLTANPPPPSP